MNCYQAIASAVLIAVFPVLSHGRALTAKPIVTRSAPVILPLGATLAAPTLKTTLAAPSLTPTFGLVVPTLQALSLPKTAVPVRIEALPQKAVNAASPTEERKEKKKSPVFENLLAVVKESKKSKKSGTSVTAFDTAGPMHLAITGPPGVGKTTQAKLIAAKTGVVHISVGQLLRVYAKDKPQIRKRMNEGKLVSTKLVMNLVRERLARPDVQERGYILDGFPRRPIEEAALQDILTDNLKLDAMIRLDAPRSELKRRILARGREDDTASVFKERMRVYRRETLPVIHKLEKDLPTIQPDGRTTRMEAIYTSLINRLARWIENR